MAVPVSLEAMVAIGGTADLWPAEFRQLVKNIEEDPEDRTQWAAVADWLQEHDEPGLERAFRWIVKRPNVEMSSSRIARPFYWMFDAGIPPGLTALWQQTADRTTIAGLMAELAAALRRHDEEAQ